MRENLIHNITILLEYSKLVQGMKLLYTNEEHFGLISLKNNVFTANKGQFL